MWIAKILIHGSSGGHCERTWDRGHATSNSKKQMIMHAPKKGTRTKHHVKMLDGRCALLEASLIQLPGEVHRRSLMLKMHWHSVFR